ncbi:MAG: hypothetical protein K2X27_12260 [Candidatus Obscuribacterales bacterium]|nr:hypothetical protein [Candidatus Obscuribacterales bacterium]
MSARLTSTMLALLIAGFCNTEAAEAKDSAQAGSQKSQKSKSSKSGLRPKSRTKSRYGHSAKLIPPPPAYMPSILPEIYYRQSMVEDDEDLEEEVAVGGVAAKPKNPYSKYFYSRDNVVPKAVQARSGVTTWTATR